MANPLPRASGPGNMQILQQQRKMQNGNPKAPHKPKHSPKKNNITNIAPETRTGDAVSDESESSDDDGDDSASDGDDESDEQDASTLSGARRAGNSKASHLTGFSRELSNDSFEDHAMTGAEAEMHNESDDEIYEGIADISDSESLADVDENSILRSAEQDLIAEFERAERPSTATGVTNDLTGMSLAEDPLAVRRASMQSEGSSDEFKGFDHTLDPFLGLDSGNDVYKAMLESAQADFYDNEIASWRLPEREDVAPSTTQKKVRFEETASSRASSMSSDEDPRDSFPDLFDEQDVMVVQHHVLFSDTGVDAITDNESVFEYDFEDEQEEAEFGGEDESAAESDISDSDSDIGDTTDEETPEEQLARVQRLKATKKGIVPALGPIPAAPRTPSTPKGSSPALSKSKPSTTSDPFSSSKVSGRPKFGTFANDPTRASVTAGSRGSGVKLVCPTKPRDEDREYWKRARQAMGSREGSPGGSVSWTRATPRTASIPQRPFTAKSTLGTMFDGDFDFLRSNDEHGIAKDLVVPSRKNSMQSSFTTTTLTDGDGTDESSNVNMADFVQMDDSDSDMEELQSANILSSVQQEFFHESLFDSSPVRDSAAGLLDHFDQQRGLVSSFRNNQHIARHVSSLPANPARRAQLSEANALQHGRRAAANTPITPARKKRQEFDGTGAGVKKLASPLVQKHRRSRGSSLSGMQATLAMDVLAKQKH